MHQIKRKRGRRPGVSVWRQRSERRQERQSRYGREWMAGCNGMAGTAGNGWQDVMGWQKWRRSHGLGCGGGSGGCSGSGGGGRDREDGRCLSSSFAISPRCERKEKCRQKCAHVE
ncbi:hypothetical protein Pcinc_039478 [Petrolisthes cinctipes]|uniref:Uncharacterized protein n=1 Tax=Petrolisthes cinctipes TaxID=88211 RepID=A0AAE1EKJ4_PETCI|nr:hypothetical protein Pcinc_039478 [Petrolisthes cinctipes]